jgi:exopolysaccharide biosynthesis protein
MRLKENSWLSWINRFPLAVALMVSGGCATMAGDRPAAPDRNTLFPGATYVRTVESQPVAQVWHVVTLDMRKVSLSVTPGDTSTGGEFVARTVSEALAISGADIGVNAGFFAFPKTPGAQRGKALDALGLSISGGVQASGPEAVHKVLDGTLCVAGKTVSLEDGQTCAGQAQEAATAGPWLLRAGQLGDWSAPAKSFSEGRHPRTAFGLSQDKKRGWLVLVDGRQAASAGATLAELAARMRELGAYDALNFDGGGSSALAIKRDGKIEVLSVPIDGGVPGKERAVANHLFVRRAHSPR